MARNPLIEKIDIAGITVPPGRRPLDEGAVKAMADSMAKMGLKTPITVWGDEHRLELVAGGHRLAAAQSLGWDEIDCFIMDADTVTREEAEMWEISENLHRAELTVMERSQQVARWVELAAKGAQLAQPSGGRQPKEAGISKAAKDLNLERRNVQRAVRIASLTPEAKQAAQERGLDDVQSALLAASVVAPERQVEAIHNIADAKARAAADRANVPAPKDWSDVEGEQMRRLMSAWNAASPTVKQWFRDQIDTPVMDQRFG